MGINNFAMKKFLFAFSFLLFASVSQICAQNTIPNNVDTVQFNVNLTKTKDIQWIENNLMYLHVIALKQTLYSISKLYNVPIDEIIAINKLKSSDNITAGQILRIPAKDVDIQKYPKPNAPIENPTSGTNIIPEISMQDTANYHYVYVKAKETLYHLSTEYHVSIEDIKKANGGLIDGLKAFSTIKIPKQKKEVTGAGIVTIPITEGGNMPLISIDTTTVMLVEHIVKPRETLYSIAKEYSISTDDIIKYNPTAIKKIKKNQVLMIPVYNVEQKEDTKPVVAPDEIKIDDTFSVDISKLPIIKSNRKFKVALLMPLYLEEDKSLVIDDATGKVVSGSSKPFRFIQFYQGAKLALDSLASLGMNVDLKVFDVDESYSKAQHLINNNSLEGFDLIIGPFYKQAYNMICVYASERGIPIINPTTAVRDNACDYDKSFKLAVDNTTKLRYIANYILVNYPNANIVFYLQKTPTPAQQVEIDYLQNRLNNAIPERIKYSNIDLYNIIVAQSAADSGLLEGQLYKNIYLENILISKNDLAKHPTEYTYINNRVKIFDYSVSGASGYNNYLSIARPNIVISFAEDNSGIADNLSRLNTLANKYEIHLFGNENWIITPDLDYKVLPNVDFHLCTYKLIDYNRDAVSTFIEQYSKSYIAEPTRYAYLGFDTFYYFGKMLYFFDKDFPKFISTVTYNGLEYSMFYNKTVEISGYENFSSGIYVIKNYQWKLMPSDDYIWNNVSVDLKNLR